MAMVPVIFVWVIEMIVTGIVVVGVLALVRLTVAPGWKFEPGIEVMVTVALCAPLLGEREPEIDGVLLFTVNRPVCVTDFLSVLITFTFHDPAAAPSRLKVQLIFVGDMIFTLVAGISGDPDRVRFTFASGWNLVPVRLVMDTGQPR